MNLDLTKYALSEEQRDILAILRVPLFHHEKSGKYFIARNYWHSIKPALREALLRVVHVHE